MDSCLVQGSVQWTERRKKSVTATDASIILGESNYCTPRLLWERKKGIAPPQPTTEAMARGTALEEVARQAYTKMTGRYVFPQVVFHGELSWMMASLDGLSIDGRMLVEIKCPLKPDKRFAAQGVPPPWYYPQLQHQMAVCCLDQMDYFSFDGESGTIVVVHRDQPFIEKMLDAEAAFYELMQGDIPPPAQQADLDREAAERSWMDWAQSEVYPEESSALIPELLR